MQHNSYEDQKKRLLEAVEHLERKEDILKALTFATKAHGKQTRDEGEPYITHPIRAANILLYELSSKDADMVMAALLHDTLEDTDTTREQVRTHFGEQVLRYVEELTIDKENETKEEKFRHLMHGDMPTRVLKMCDCIDNMRSVEKRTDRGERWHRNLREAKELFMPLAQSTGEKKIITALQGAIQRMEELTEKN